MQFFFSCHEISPFFLPLYCPNLGVPQAHHTGLFFFPLARRFASPENHMEVPSSLDWGEGEVRHVSMAFSLFHAPFFDISDAEFGE
jgi:hypothetical protein